MDEVNWTQVVIALVLGLIIPGWKAWKSGKLNDFLVQKVETLADKPAKDAIKADAISQGIEAALHKVVARNGLASKT